MVLMNASLYFEDSINLIGEWDRPTIIAMTYGNYYRYKRCLENVRERDSIIVLYSREEKEKIEINVKEWFSYLFRPILPEFQDLGKVYVSIKSSLEYT